ncbi:DUF6268 family outer membrane beta-barrel protein [Xanthocytophaga agilis]|uniref:DUF6268 family outer membrane beta-barrel protein n=1 Tax=Xanthocytophaga agilis TaxID=3048010 RepID=UPI003B0099CA
MDTATGKVKLLNGAFFGKTTPFSKSGYNKQILPDDLHSISAYISYYSSMNNTWTYTLFLTSVLTTDFISVDYNDLSYRWCTIYQALIW